MELARLTLRTTATNFLTPIPPGIITWLVPCVTFGQNAEAVGVTSCVMGAIALFIPIVNLYCLIKVRGKI